MVVDGPLHGDGHVASAPAVRGGGTIRIEGLGKTYRSGAGEVQALAGIELDIAAGEVFGIIGRSGAGKSSLLRTINRLEHPSAGRVLVDGQDIAALDEAGLVALRRRVGMIFQHFNLLSAKTVRENVALPQVRDMADRPSQVVISLASAESEFGTFDPAVVQLFEGFRIPPDRDACIWEPRWCAPAPVPRPSGMQTGHRRRMRAALGVTARRCPV